MDVQHLSDELVESAVRERIQDVSILPYGEEFVIYFTKSHYRKHYRKIHAELAQQLITRFKYLGEMDVGEKRKAQLGAVNYQLTKGCQRLRISTVADYQGKESMVLRFLYPLMQQLNCFFPEHYQILCQQTGYRGLYLFAGPTGSGKTSLMYSLAQEETGQVIAIEDPVEIEEPRFLQLQINEKIGQGYDELIRLSLRHRPELLVIGEIRSYKTAQAAIRAALTGHRVFATVHAKGIEATKKRLAELLGSSQELTHCLMGIIYQRLLPTETQEIFNLFGYQFYHQKKTGFSFEEAKKQLKEQGLVEDDLLEKE